MRSYAGFEEGANELRSQAPKTSAHSSSREAPGPSQNKLGNYYEIRLAM